MNVYASFVRPGMGIKRKVLFVHPGGFSPCAHLSVPAGTTMNGLMGEWQASTHQLVERLHPEVGEVEGEFHPSYSHCYLVAHS